MDDLMGVKIIMAPWMTKPEVIRRTWRNRLFSWPWRPWVRTVVFQIPSNEVIMFQGTAMMHPATYAKMKKVLDAPRA